MLEDIRGHSPVPSEQELLWIAARPFRQLLRVAALAIVAIVLANSATLHDVPAAIVTAAAPAPQ